nr:hypothetical protein [Tanacetum cinerariifolium]
RSCEFFPLSLSGYYDFGSSTLVLDAACKKVLNLLKKCTRETFSCYKGPYDLSYVVLIIRDVKSKTTKDIISNRSFMEVLVLNHYVLVKNVLPPELDFNDFLAMLFEPVSITAKLTRLFSSFTRGQTRLTYYYMWMISFLQLLLLYSCNVSSLYYMQDLPCRITAVPHLYSARFVICSSIVMSLHVLHYLRGTTDLGLQLFRSATSQLIAYSDADWAGCPATVVYVSANPVQHQCTKHIEIDIYFVRDKVAAGHVRVLRVPSRFQYVKRMLTEVRRGCLSRTKRIIHVYNTDIITVDQGRCEKWGTKLTKEVATLRYSVLALERDNVSWRLEDHVRRLSLRKTQYLEVDRYIAGQPTQSASE